MNSKLCKTVASQFSRRLRATLPKFTEIKPSTLPPGWVCFRSSHTLPFHCFLVLAIAPREDRFTVDIGWSLTGDFPEGIWFGPDDSPKNDALLFRLSRLWQTNGMDHWWRLGRELSLEEMARFEQEDSQAIKMSQVESKVEDAIQHILKYGVPYLEKIAHTHGCAVKLR